MCPLRLILIFLSATLAGFFLIRNIKSRPQIHDDDIDDDHNNEHPPPSKIQSGFWALLDMASGRYLWSHLVSSKPTAALTHP